MCYHFSKEQTQEINVLKTEVTKFQALYNAALIEEQNHREMQTVLMKRFAFIMLFIIII